MTIAWGPVKAPPSPSRPGSAKPASSCSLSAVMGGVTGVFEMPNTQPLTTTRAAFDLGFTSTLLADCCATRNLQYLDRIVLAADVQNAYLAALDKTFAQVLTTKQYLHGEH